MSLLIGKALAENWQPSDDDRDYGHKLGFTNGQIDEFAEDLRLWAAANAHRQVGRKANWNAAFRGWMRRTLAKTRPVAYQAKPPLPLGYERGNPDNWKRKVTL